MRGGGAPEHVVPAARAAHGLINLAQRTAGNEAVLTGGSWWPEARRSGVGGEVRRRWRGGARGPVTGVVLRAPGLHGSMCGVPEMAFGFDSGDARTGVGGRSLGDVPGVRAELRRWISVAAMVWGAGSTAAQGSALTRRSRGGCG